MTKKNPEIARREVVAGDVQEYEEKTAKAAKLDRKLHGHEKPKQESGEVKSAAVRAARRVRNPDLPPGV